MHDPMMPWLTRRPPLLDSAGAPVLPTSPSIPLIDPEATHGNQRAMLRDPPTQHIAEDLGAVPITQATQAPQLVLPLQARRDDS